MVLAFAVNLAIAIAKTAAGLLTLSSAMLAEAAHSWADTTNQVFLLFALRELNSRTTRASCGGPQCVPDDCQTDPTEAGGRG